jgi:hypothetical protein
MASSALTAPVVRARRSLRTPVAWGVVFSCIQAASPLAFIWLSTATVYALGLVLMAAVYPASPLPTGAGTSLQSRRSSRRCSSSSLPPRCPDRPG